MHACAHFVCTLRSHGVVQGFQATKHVPRDINPIFKSMVMLTDVEGSEMLQFLIKDVGVFESPHVMGVGPKLVASTTLKVGEDFNGWLEMVPAKLIAGQGGPVLQVSLRHSALPDPRAALPSVGNTSIHVEMFDAARGNSADNHQATRGMPSPSAPPQVDEPNVKDPSLSSPEMFGEPSCELGSSGVPEFWSSGYPPVTQNMGEPEPCPEHRDAGAGRGEFGSLESSSVFYIDPAVFTSFPDLHVLRRLFDMQRLQQTDPFPSAPFRNYNIFGAGFDKTAGDFPKDYRWEIHPGCWNKAKLDLCVEQFNRLVENPEHRHWCESVKVIQKVLLWAQACRMWPRHDACLNSCAPFMQRDAHVVFIRVALASSLARVSQQHTCHA